MPGRVCAVAVCKNNQLVLKKKGVSIVFHTFPKAKDLVSSTIRKEWVHRCGRSEEFNIDTNAVCSDHFSPNDYERDLEHELLNLPPRKILKKTAVPTVNLDQEYYPIDVLPLPVAVPDDNCADEVQGLSQIQSSTPTTNPQQANYKILYEELLKKHAALRTSSRKKIKSLQGSLTYYKTKYYNRSINRKDKSKRAGEILKVILIQNENSSDSG